ncbi:MAG: polymer-forming cytoskeletal protein [Nitrospirae bacterium]|nr:polymer-forming cytoskeletal protein [Candidatus Manganitrophaceae bacterium]
MAFGREESPARESDELIIFMGKSVEIKGDIHFQGSGRLDGKVTGKINVDGTLILGEGAMISSEIEGDTVIVGGTVKGKILGRQSVQLLKTSVVNCDITTPSLVIEEGAQFNGGAKMGSSAAVEKIPTPFPLTNEENKRKSVVQAVK